MSKYVNNNTQSPIASVEFASVPGGTYVVLTGRNCASTDVLQEKFSTLPEGITTIAATKIDDKPAVILHSNKPSKDILQAITQHAAPDVNFAPVPKKKKRIKLDLMQIRGWLGYSAQMGMLFSALDKSKSAEFPDIKKRPTGKQYKEMLQKRLLPKFLMPKALRETVDTSTGSDADKRKSALLSMIANLFVTGWGIEDAEDTEGLSNAEQAIIDKITEAGDALKKEKLEALKDKEFDKTILDRTKEKGKEATKKPLRTVNQFIKDNNVKISNAIKVPGKFLNFTSGLKEGSVANSIFGGMTFSAKLISMLGTKKKKFLSKKQKHEEAMLGRLQERSGSYRFLAGFRKFRENATRIAGRMEVVAMLASAVGCFPTFNNKLKKIDIGQLWFACNLIVGFTLKAIAPTKVEKIRKEKLYDFAKEALADVPEDKIGQYTADICAGIAHHLEGEDISLTEVLSEIDSRLRKKRIDLPSLAKKAEQIKDTVQEKAEDVIEAVQDFGQSYRDAAEQQGHDNNTSLFDRIRQATDTPQATPAMA